MSEVLPTETAKPKLKVAVCGAPRVGKTETLLALQRQISGSELQVQALPDRFTTLGVSTFSQTLSFATCSGSVFYRPRMKSLVLEGAHAVVFIYPAATGGTHDLIENFHEWVYEAKRLGTCWDSVPWLFARNMVDRGQGDPLFNVIPDSPKIFRMELVATRGQGISELLDWALRVTGAKR